MNTLLTYSPVILPVVAGIIAITLHIKTSKHNFTFENRKLGTNADSKWSLRWFDFAIISLHLAFIAFMNIYFLAGQHDDIILSTMINGLILFMIDIQNLVFEIDMSNDVNARMKTIKI